MKRWRTLLLMIPLCVWLIAGCTQKTEETGINDEPVVTEDGDFAPLKNEAEVIIAEDGSASGAGFYIAKEKGYFKDYNINVKFTKFQNSSDMLPALAAGQIDVAGGISSASFFNSIAQGINVKMIGDKGHNVAGHSYFSFVIRKDLEGKINSYEDLKGKTIAVSAENSIDDYIFQMMLDHAGLKRSDVHFKLMADFGNMLAALSNKTVDAALEIEPLITKAEAEGIAVRLGDTTDYAPKAQIAMVLASPQFIGKDRDVAVRFMAAYLKGIRDYNDAFVKGTADKAPIIKIMTEYTSLKDPEIWKKVDVTGLDPDGKMYVDDIKKQYEWYKQNGGISGDLDFNKTVDTRLAEEALKAIGEYK